MCLFCIKIVIQLSVLYLQKLEKGWGMQDPGRDVCGRVWFGREKVTGTKQSCMLSKYCTALRLRIVVYCMVPGTRALPLAVPGPHIRMLLVWKSKAVLHGSHSTRPSEQGLVL